MQRQKDYARAFNDAIQKIKAMDPKLLILGGDIFHHTRPDPKSMQIFLRKLMELADKISIVACIGNHEIEGHLGTTYTPIFSDLHRNIHVLTTDNPSLKLDIDGRKIGVHGFQYLRGRENAEKTLTEISEGAWGSDLEILCLHQGLEKYVDPYEISLRKLREVADKYDLILLGHIHKHQKITEIFDLTPTYYIGSTERISFGEWQNINGFLAFRDFDFRNPDYVEVKSAKMKQIKENIGERTPHEINSYISGLIMENMDVECLQISVDTKLKGSYFDLRHDWDEQFSEFTILDVNISPITSEEPMELKKLRFDDALNEYLEKRGMIDRKDLKDVCLRLHGDYSG